MTSTCIFCGIVSGEAPAHRVYEDEQVIAFLDARPLFHGHTLVIPRSHHETLANLPSVELPAFFEAVKLLSHAVVAATDSVGTFVAMNNRVSQSVPHLHCHVVPRVPKDGLRGFFWPRTKYGSDEQMAEVAERIRLAGGSR